MIWNMSNIGKPDLFNRVMKIIYNPEHNRVIKHNL